MSFDKWWDKHKKGFYATPLMEKCFNAGFDEGLGKGFLATRIIKWLIVAVVIMVVALLMSGCEDRYRYPCQDPANFKNPECKPPLCVADGSCTDYLVRKPK